LTSDNSKVSKADKEKIMINFQSASEKEDIGEIFLKFLKSEFNQEPWLFLKEIKKLDSLKDEDEISKQVNYLMDTYIKDNSVSEVNISGKSKRELLQDFESNDFWKKDPIGLFSNVKKIVEKELFQDNWKRFIRSKEGDKIIEKYYRDPSGIVKFKIQRSLLFIDCFQISIHK
jgi:hypothetical protein